MSDDQRSVTRGRTAAEQPLGSVIAEDRIESVARNREQSLSLSGLRLEELPRSLADLTELRELDLSRNSLTVLPDWLCALGLLRTLDLSDNRLTTVGPGVSRCRALKTLRLNGNRLTSVPVSLRSLPGLDSLDLSHNELTEVPQWLTNKGIQKLKLTGNGGLPKPSAQVVTADLQRDERHAPAPAPALAPAPTSAHTEELPALIPGEPRAVRRRRTPAMQIGWIVVVLGLVCGAYAAAKGVGRSEPPTGGTVGATTAAAAQNTPALRAAPSAGQPSPAADPAATEGIAPPVTVTQIVTSPVPVVTRILIPGGSPSAAPAPTGPAAVPLNAAGTVLGEAGWCLDDHSAATAAGNPIQVFPCNGTPSQEWAFDSADHEVQVFGECLDYSGATYATPVVIVSCDGSGQQVWIPRSDRSLYNPQAGMCLNEPVELNGAGTPVDLEPCTGSAYQQWEFPPA
jgi:Ricin-type beta-trefoil lectin domain/Leucine rich repeat